MQLAELGRSFEFIHGRDLLRALQDGFTLPEQACLITFDDGLREQYRNAFPILEKHGVSGVFFICTQPMVEGIGLTVHKMHWLRATRPPQVFLQQILEAATAAGMPFDPEDVDDEAANRQYLYDDMPTKRVKYLLNHMMPFKSYRQLIGELFAREMDERTFCADMYMRERDLLDLGAAHTIASHAHFHCPLSGLDPETLRDNLAQSRELLTAIMGSAVNLISYPYGGPSAVSTAVADTAAAVGFLAGFTMERSLNHTLGQPHLLARVSTNDAPGGKAPLIDIGQDGRGIVTHPPMKAFRSEYFDERGGVPSPRHEEDR
jgi:peptidoglycan/xylan/chitin deacetylase (PgdA/CDA1 family)